MTTSDLWLPVGEPGSGRRRYAAAMARHAGGGLSDAALEVYRICSARDGDDPLALMSAWGVTPPTLPGQG